jgi:hypothetical protein
MQVASADTATKSVLLLGEQADATLVQLLAEGFWRPEFLRPAQFLQKPPAGVNPHVGLICLRHTRAGARSATAPATAC